MLGKPEREQIQTWTDKNPGYRHEVLTAESSEIYILDRFADDPDIKEVFLELHDPILRADLIRYLVLLADGGVYNDLDVRCIKPIKDWVAPELFAQAAVVVGVELDLERNGERKLQFCSWTVMAKPHQAAMRLVVDRVIENIRALAELKNATLSALKPSYDDVISTTGPRAFSEAVFESMSLATGTEVGYRNFTGIREPKLLGEVLVLPVSSFGSGQAHSGSGKWGNPDELVQHMWKGTWKASHPARG